MAIDAYSQCPGGTGKKIKFCCSDSLPELQKIDRMIEGEQYLACLQHIDQLMAQEPGRDRACLLATKCMLLRVTNQREAARNTAAAFCVKHPNNQVALAEMAILAAETNVRAALEMIIRALRAADGDLAGRTYQAMGLVAGSLLHAGLPVPARALLQLQCDISQEDDRPAELLAALSQAIDIPLLLRDDLPLMPCPKDAPWSNRFDEAMQPAVLGDWATAVERLAALAGDVPDSPIIWRNLAILRGWIGDNAGCGEALRRYAAIRVNDADGLEDATEAEAKAMFLSGDPLGDRLDVFKVTWMVSDVERALESLLSSPRWLSVPFDPARFSDGENPPPKGAYTMLDRPMPAAAEGITIETMPRVIGHALLFGRQTDREARLEVMSVAADELADANRMVREAVGDVVPQEPQQDVVGSWSASQKLLRASWQPPRGMMPDQFRSLMAEHARDAVLRAWPELKLGVLDGRSPKEAAGDPACRTKLLAAILVVEFWAGNLPGTPDFNDLRSQLGLPTLGPIDIAKNPIEELPMSRLSRVSLEGLSDHDLLSAYFRASAFAIRDASLKFATAVVERPSLADSDERLHAYTTLARNEEDVSKALAHIAEGRRATDAKKVSHATWDLMELSIHFAHQNGPEAMRLIEHIQQRHLEEPGVGEMLTRLLIDVGLLRPDGSPAYLGPGGAAPTAVPEAAAEPQGLWTPDSAPNSGGAAGKLWTPDS
jgi:hypothetical protein